MKSELLLREPSLGSGLMSTHGHAFKPSKLRYGEDTSAMNGERPAQLVNHQGSKALRCDDFDLIGP